MIPLAHGLDVGRQDLPLPEWLFAWGAALVLIVSFALLSLAWRTARLQREEWRALPARLSSLPANPAVEAICGVIGVGLLALVVYAGLEGTEDAPRNFSVIFVFVTFWLGLVVLSVLFGDVFRAFNPWRAIARAFSAGFRLIAGQPAPAPLRLPERLGCWPAVIGLVAFVWFELVYGATGLTAGVGPRDTAVAALAYSAITFAGMALFGIETWTERGETFSVYFRMFSRLSVLELRRGRLGRRRFLSGPPNWRILPGSLALVLVTIGATTYDGAQEGALETPITETFEWLQGDVGLSGLAAFRITGSIWLAVVLAAVALLFWLGVRGMRTVQGSPPARDLARSFAHTLIPIALAYLVAHYFTLVVYQEQAQFTFLLSDPLGDGSDLFGTAGTPINYFVGANAVWYVQVGALIAGHVTALTLAHDRAIAVYDDYAKASRSQYFMLAVMVAFTTLGLFLLSQSNA